MCERSEKEYLQVLSDGFNFTNFKSDDQKRAIECVVSKNYKNIIISMATQAGKSLCYQLPKFFQRSGVVLVVSPTISLITNQVAYLNEMRIPATTITSFTPSSIRMDLIKEFRDAYTNPYQFLYVTPEMLAKGSENVRNMINELMLMNEICLVAIDEAHQVIDVGLTYRPCYLYLAEVRRKYPDINWVAVTTASMELISLIAGVLQMKDPQIIKGPSVRKNIFYDVIEWKCQKIKDLIEDLMELDEKQEKHVTKKIYASGIIYCQTNYEADRIAKELCEDGISSKSFYGVKNDKTLIQKEWKDGKFPVLVATEESFGTGINRTPLQFVVHISVPNNFRSFYQQSGRVSAEHGYSRIIYRYYGHWIVSDEKMREYLKFKGCRHQYIATYFGDEELKPCGNKCDNCINNRKI